VQGDLLCLRTASTMMMALLRDDAKHLSEAT
jgi:hypothetical protein